MDDQNQINDLEVSGAGGGGGGRSRPKQTQAAQTIVVQAPTRQPVVAANNLFSVAFAKTVYALSEGVLEGSPNRTAEENINFKDVYLDGVPIQNPDGTNNFEGFTLESRLGEDETQTPITGFSATENTVGVNVNVTQASGAITKAITDTDTESCRVIIALPALQVQNQSNGDISGTSVQFSIEVNSNGGSYTTISSPTISGKSNSEFQRAYEFDLPGTGPWNVRVKRL